MPTHLQNSIQSALKAIPTADFRAGHPTQAMKEKFVELAEESSVQELSQGNLPTRSQIRFPPRGQGLQLFTLPH